MAKKSQIKFTADEWDVYRAYQYCVEYNKARAWQWQKISKELIRHYLPQFPGDKGFRQIKYRTEELIKKGFLQRRIRWASVGGPGFKKFSEYRFFKFKK